MFVNSAKILDFQQKSDRCPSITPLEDFFGNRQNLHRFLTKDLPEVNRLSLL